jgi:formate dehydrogenase major subunit
MSLSRRNFLKISGGTAAAGVLGADIGSPAEVSPPEKDLRIKGAKETNTICPYCSVGCGIIVHTKDGKVINTEGDPDHPINEGTLCSKGASLYQLVNNPQRLAKPRYRAPGAGEWKEVEWDWALDEIAKRVKETRDATFKTHSKSKVKGTMPDGMAHVGSAALDNEECYMLQKLLRSWGLVYVEHQARI